jgi:triosephosphate isomerase
MIKPIIAGNWKMYKTIAEAIELSNALKREFFKLDFSKVDMVICPPFTALAEVSEVLNQSGIFLGAQNMEWHDEGAYTGEISPKMLKDAGATFVIIGHSERRQYFNETNDGVNQKIKTALRYNLTPIACVGETLQDRDAGNTFKVLDDHVKGALKDLTANDILKVVIAYEPVWAIGTGRTATPAQAQEAHKYIRELLVKLYNQEIANQVRIQYGGSVKPENITALMKQPDVDGALVGGASLTAVVFADIVKKASEVVK